MCYVNMCVCAPASVCVCVCDFTPCSASPSRPQPLACNAWCTHTHTHTHGNCKEPAPQAGSRLTSCTQLMQTKRECMSLVRNLGVSVVAAPTAGFSGGNPYEGFVNEVCGSLCCAGCLFSSLGDPARTGGGARLAPNRMHLLASKACCHCRCRSTLLCCARKTAPSLHMARRSASACSKESWWTLGGCVSCASLGGWGGAGGGLCAWQRRSRSGAACRRVLDACWCGPSALCGARRLPAAHARAKALDACWPHPCAHTTVALAGSPSTHRLAAPTPLPLVQVAPSADGSRPRPPYLSTAMQLGLTKGTPGTPSLLVRGQRAGGGLRLLHLSIWELCMLVLGMAKLTEAPRLRDPFPLVQVPAGEARSVLPSWPRARSAHHALHSSAPPPHAPHPAHSSHITRHASHVTAPHHAPHA